MTTIYDDCSKEELLQIVSEMQSSLNYCKIDLKQAVIEIKLLNKQIDKLITENNALRQTRKMFTKTLLNQLYGCCYADTDSIKAESEDE